MTLHSSRFRAAAGIAALVLALAAPITAQAFIPTLWAVTGAGGNTGCNGTPSSLYTMDSNTGAAFLVGPVMIGATQARHITGLAFHPSTGVLYAVMNQFEADCSDNNTATLLTINTGTAEATVVGSLGSMSGQYPDIAFDPFGTLYAWNENSPSSDDLYIIDTATGTSTEVSANGPGTYRTGLASDSKGNLYLKSNDVLYRMNQYTGTDISNIILDRETHNVLAFNVSDVLYSGVRDDTGFTLITIDRETGATTTIGSNAVTNIGAITFYKGTPTPPPVSDLSLTKEIDDPNPTVGDDVVFTLTVANDGPDAAENVVVRDVLPDGYSYVSQSGDGTYDETTGEWTAPTVAASNSVTMQITATVTPTKDYTNSAEVVASGSYDSDSIAGSGDTNADMYDEVTPDVLFPRVFSIDRDSNKLWVIDPTNTQVDMSHDLTVSGDSICTGFGLAAQPTTNALFGVVTLSDCNTRQLATIDPATGETTIVGSFGDLRVAAIAFGADQDTLYAATANNNGSSTHTLFTVDPTTGAATARCVLPADRGRALTFADGLIYDAYQNCNNDCQTIITTIDPASFPADPADPCGGTPLSTGIFAEFTGLTTISSGGGTVSLLAASFTTLYSITIPGQSDPTDFQFVASLSHNSRGLAIAAADVIVGNLSAFKASTRSRVKGKKMIDYQISAHNDGPDTINNVVLTDEIPFGTTLLSSDSECQEVGGVLSCDMGSIVPGSETLVHFTVQVTCKKCSSIYNQVNVSTTDNIYDYPFDNQDSVETSLKGKF